MAHYSKLHKFYFVHIYKTGGMAVRRSLEISLNSINKNDTSDFMQGHCNAKDAAILITHHNIQPEDFFKFSFVRNPYDWIFSTWYYIITSKGHNLNTQFAGKPFKDFLVWHRDEIDKFNEGKGLGFNKIQSQYEFLHDKGNLLVDFVGRKENLLNDLRFVFDTIKIPLYDIGWVNSYKAHRNNRPFMSYYNNETKEIVKQMLNKDFETYGYDK